MGMGFGIMRKAAILACFTICVVIFMTLVFAVPVQADAAVYVGGEEIHGYEPQDIVTTDMQLNAQAPSEVSGKLENMLVNLIRVAMPFLMIACAAILAGNAIANIFRPKEKRVHMGELIKNMLVQFFFILFAFVIVEAIVFVVTGGQTILLSTILS